MPTDSDDDLIASPVPAISVQSKTEAIETELKLEAQKAAYREISKWRGKLKWEGDAAIDWTLPQPEAEADPAHRPNQF